MVFNFSVCIQTGWVNLFLFIPEQKEKLMIWTDVLQIGSWLVVQWGGSVVFEQSFVICPRCFLSLCYLILCLDGSFFQRTEVTGRIQNKSSWQQEKLAGGAWWWAAPLSPREEQLHEPSSWVLMAGRQHQRGGRHRYGCLELCGVTNEWESKSAKLITVAWMAPSSCGAGGNPGLSQASLIQRNCSNLVNSFCEYT